MTVIVLDRKNNVLRTSSRCDIPGYIDTVIYNVTHVTHRGIGWYDVYSGISLIGHVVEVTEVKERW